MTDLAEQAVREVVQQYIDGTYKGDAAALRDSRICYGVTIA